MTGTMRAVIKTAAAPGNIELRTLPIPQIGPRDLLVRVKAAAVCGTDVHIRHWNAWAQARMHPPVVIGHEFSGEVVETGSEVHTVNVGDRVSAESHIPCNHCQICHEGNRHVCPNTKCIGVHRDGCFAEYIAIPEEIAFVYNDPALPWEQLALMEPFGVSVHGMMDVPLATKSVVIIGAGLSAAMRYLRPEGQLTCVALPDQPISVSISDFGYRGCSIRGIAGRRIYENWEQMRGLLARGIDLSPIVSHVLPLDQFERGLDMTERGQCAKCILIP